MSRVAVVTGANRGIGLAIATRLAAEGMRVVLASRSASAGEEAASRYPEHAGRISVGTLDVADRGSIVDFTRWLHRTHGRCDVLVNNAAVAIDGAQDAGTADLGLVRATLEVNLFGAWQMTQALVPAMRARGYGRIVNMSSGVGRLSAMTGGIPGYRVSKTALNALTLVFADELRADGILVNACCPGHVRTGMGGAGAERSAEAAADTPVWLAGLPPDGPTGGFFRDRRPLAW